MLDDGTHLAVGDDTVLKLFGNESATPTWEFPMQYTIKGVKLSITGIRFLWHIMTVFTMPPTLSVMKPATRLPLVGDARRRHDYFYLLR